MCERHTKTILYSDLVIINEFIDDYCDHFFVAFPDD